MKYVCFWCEGEFWEHERRRTKEHLIPVCLGGTNDKDNIRYVCHDCNYERGRITSLYGIQKHIILRLKKWQWTSIPKRREVRRAIKSFRKQLLKVKPLQVKWVALELAKIGRTPSNIEFLNLSCPGESQRNTRYIEFLHGVSVNGRSPMEAVEKSLVGREILLENGKSIKIMEVVDVKDEKVVSACVKDVEGNNYVVFASGEVRDATGRVVGMTEKF